MTAPAELQHVVWISDNVGDLRAAMPDTRVPKYIDFDYEHVYERTIMLVSHMLCTSPNVYLWRLAPDTWPTSIAATLARTPATPGRLIYLDTDNGSGEPVIDALCALISADAPITYFRPALHMHDVCTCNTHLDPMPSCSTCNTLVKVCEALEDNRNMARLTMRMYSANARVSGAVRRMLAKNEGLLRLDLANNSVLGGHDVFSGLAHNTTLKVLDLRFIHGEDEDVDVLVQMLEANMTLETLLLGNSLFSAEASQRFAAALLKTNTLKELTLGIEALSAEAIRGWAAVVRVHTSLIRLVIRQSFSPGFVRGVQEALEDMTDALTTNHTLRWFAMPGVAAYRERKKWDRLLYRNWTRYVYLHSLQRAVAYRLVSAGVTDDVLAQATPAVSSCVKAIRDTDGHHLYVTLKQAVGQAALAGRPPLSPAQYMYKGGSSME